MLESLIQADIILLNSLRSLINQDSSFQVGLIRMGTDIEVVLVMLVLVGLWLYGVYKGRNQYKTDALMIFYSIGFAFCIYVILNLGLPFRPRPETVSAIRPLVDHLPDNSFPSGHAIFFGSSVLAAFYYTRAWIAWILFWAGIFMIFSRVFAGIHYPGDILVGSLIGFLGAFTVYSVRDKKFITDYLLVYPVKIAKFFRL